jgi:hypothetical protein
LGLESNALNSSSLDLSDPSTYANGCHLRPLEQKIKPCFSRSDQTLHLAYLLGDSHAAQWVPALENSNYNKTFRVKFVTKSSCPYTSMNLTSDCDRFIGNAINEIRRLRPNVLLLASMTNSSYKHYLQESKYTFEWIYNLNKLIEALPKNTLPIIIEDTPYANFDTADCLAKKEIQACSFKFRESLLTKKLREYAVSKEIDYLRYSDLLCQQKICSAGNSKMNYYKDAHHISVTLSKQLGSKLDVDVESAFQKSMNKL